MKREELEKLGLSKAQIDKVLDMHHEEYDPLKKQKDAAESELETVKKKNGAQEETIQKLKTDLEGFKNEDVSGMKRRIADLEKDIQTKDAEYQKEISERDFNDVLKDAIPDW